MVPAGARIMARRDVVCGALFQPHAGAPVSSGACSPAIARPISSRPVVVGPGLGQVAVVHHGDAVAEFKHLVEIVGDEQDAGYAGVARGDELFGERRRPRRCPAPRWADVPRSGSARPFRLPRRRQQGAAENQLLHVAADDVRAAVVAPPPRMSKWAMTASAWSRATLRRIHVRREKARVRRRSATAFSQRGRSPITPTACRSSGPGDASFHEPGRGCLQRPSLPSDTA